MKQELYTAKQIAELLGMDHMTILNWIKSGYIKAIKIGRQYRIKQSELERILEEDDGDARADEEMERKVLS